jgi:hypothetical protein
MSFLPKTDEGVSRAPRSDVAPKPAIHTVLQNRASTSSAGAAPAGAAVVLAGARACSRATFG